MGQIEKKDILIIFSYSGNTSELNNMLKFANRFRIKIIGVASKPESILLKASDIKLVIPKVKEADVIGMVPTSSTSITLLLGDCLATTVMYQRKFSKEKFKVFHPGGKLGTQMLKIKDLMHGKNKIPTVTPEMTMQEALLKMTSKGFGYAVVVKENKVHGVISDGDLRRHINQLFDKKAGQIATKNPITVKEDIFVAEAIKIMNDNKIGVLVITNNKNEPIGITHIQDLLKAGAV